MRSAAAEAPRGPVVYEDQDAAVAAANRAAVRLEVAGQGRRRRVVEERACALAQEGPAWLVRCRDGVWIACRAVPRR